MRTYSCACGQRLFFDNTRCLACERDVGWCPHCRAIRGLDRAGEGRWRCTAPGCGALLAACENAVLHGVCNRMIDAGGGPLCDTCRYNQTVPDSTLPGHRQKWKRIEAAKRRLFFTLDQLGLPHGTAQEGFDPPLAFDFKAELVRDRGEWQTLSPVERVFTGHARGRITINLDEADDAEREKRRIDMKEAHRTLIGHFRHEIAHYYWELLVRGAREAEFVALFGNHEDPPYGDALKRYYENGPPADWSERFVSAYATMHPWEDFAETFAFYLDMIAVLDTARHWGMTQVDPERDELQRLTAEHGALGLRLNEINRDMGLLDVVPEALVPAVMAKLRFIDALMPTRAAAAAPAAAAATTRE